MNNSMMHLRNQKRLSVLFYFADEETEAQRGESACSESHS